MSGHHQKHLHELLSQDQEPFLLHDYLLHRLRQLHPTSPPLPLSTPKTRHLPFPSLYGFSLKRQRFVPSRDPANSPLFEFPLPVPPPRSPCQRAAVSLLVPARTAALLLEAASRIQRSGSARLPRKQSLGGRVVGLVLKRFARRKSKSSSDDNEPPYFKSPSGGCDHGIGSGVEGSGTVCDEHIRNSPLPVERQECSCLEEWPTEFPSSPASPKHAGEGNEGKTDRCSDTCSASKGKNVDDEEEERQQFSPVSVLDPPFEVDDEDGESPVANDEEGDPNRVDTGFDYDCSFAFVQRTKQQLLDNLQRFERLARLDPVELEKRMLESDDEEAETEHEDRLTVPFPCLRKSPDGISKLVMDLIAEEEGDSESRDHENGKSVVARVNKRLESWEGEGSQTIDMIVDGELRARWEPGEEQFGLLAGEIEVGMFESLLEELTAENSSC
ncbi:hypothetical protein MLD38_026624 [Melastoma candidum]|uniref:Uncharacterized protein n=1 Tax=Melastoma candidum TaxID=119954 RepID=A0ACB9P464_9MYRT|nr:hypothetical protein MLD38_026624 [Melastoma candidum]